MGAMLLAILVTAAMLVLKTGEARPAGATTVWTGRRREAAAAVRKEEKERREIEKKTMTWL